MVDVAFVDQPGRPRSGKVTLEWPVVVDGVEWTEIEVRRITTAELADFFSSPEGTSPPGINAPAAVLDALDAEDGFRIQEAAARFFPRRSPTPTESA